MLKTYYLTIRAIPNRKSPLYGKGKGIHASFWVVDETGANAIERANRYLSDYGYVSEAVEKEPVETVEEHYYGPDKEFALVNFRKAQKLGIAAVFLGWENDYLS